MTNQTFNNRRVIWESKGKQFWIIVGSFLFVLIAFWTKQKLSHFMFWTIIIFFGGGGLYYLVRLLNPMNLFVTNDTPLAQQILAERFQKVQEDFGLFVYNDTGFSFQNHNGVTQHKWTDIETLFGYKEDRFTTDEICLDIFTIDNLYIRLTESTPGWHQFNKRLRVNIPTVGQNWDFEIAFPAFDTNLTLLFDKKGRNQKEAEADCYAK